MRPRRRLSVFFIVAGLVLLFFSAGLFLLDRFFLRDLKPVVRTMLSDMVSAPVDLADVSFHPFRGLVLSGLTVGASNRTCVSLDRLSLGFNLLSLFSGKLSFSSAQLSDLTVTLSAGSTNLTPFFLSRIGSFMARGGGGKKGGFQVELSSLRLERLIVRTTGAEDRLDRLDFRPGASGGRVRFEAANVRDFLSVSGEGVIGAESSLEILYKPLKREWRSRITGGRMKVSWKDFSALEGVNTLTGRDLLLRTSFTADPGNGRITVPENPSNRMIMGRERVSVSGGLDRFDAWKVQAAFPSVDTSALSPILRGTVSGQARLDGSLKKGSWILREAEVSSEKIAVDGVLSNGLELQGVNASVRDGRIVAGRLVLLAGAAGRAEIRLQSSDLFRKNASLICEADLPDFDLDGLKFVQKGAPGKSFFPLPFLPDIRLRAGRVKAGPVVLERVFISCRQTEEGRITGEAKGVQKDAEWKSSFGFDPAEEILSWQIVFDAFDIATMAEAVSSKLSGSGRGDYLMKTRTLRGRVDLASGQMAWKDLSLTRLSGVLSVTGQRVSGREIGAAFYRGDINASLDYDLAAKSGSFTMDGSGIRVEDLFPVLVPDEPAARVSGRAGCRVKGELFPSGGRVSGRLDLGKGLIRDTRYQKDLDRILSTDVFNDLMYDAISADFRWTPQAVEIAPLILVSPDLEIEMRSSYPLGGKGPRASMIDLYLSRDFLDRMQNILKVPMAVISRKDRRWTWVRLEESSGSVRAVKPGK